MVCWMSISLSTPGVCVCVVCCVRVCVVCVCVVCVCVVCVCVCVCCVCERGDSIASWRLCTTTNYNTRMYTNNPRTVLFNLVEEKVDHDEGSCPTNPSTAVDNNWPRMIATLLQFPLFPIDIAKES